MKKLRVLVLLHGELVPPDSLDGYSDKQIAEWKTEFDVVTALKELGHEVRPLGMTDDLGVLRTAIMEWKPDVAFNLLEEFQGVGLYDQHVVSYLELMRVPYTGCNPRGLMLTHDKPLMKKILAFHRVPTPRFATFPIGRRGNPPRRLTYPLLAKLAVEDASLGISQASVVQTEEKLMERVAYLHNEFHTDVIAEEFIAGRELYVGVIGNQRLTTFPVWEMTFANMPKDQPRIATAKVKWDEEYQKKLGIATGPAKDLPEGMPDQLARLCKRIFRILNLSGYARMDLRLGDDGRAFVLEANANPNLAYGEDFAESAETVGVDFPDLIRRILNLGLRYQGVRRS
jgi:D-alanine-D-alanine ligase